MQLIKDNASALLVGSISAVATTLTVESARADLFPIGNTTNHAAPLDWFKATLEDVSGNIEIVYVGTRAAASGVMSTVLRGQEGTTARAFAAGSVVEQRVTAIDLQSALINGGSPSGFKNRIINGQLNINQRGVSGTVTLAAGAYGHDRFKAGASGCTYTFATSANVTTLTITAGTL
ncbi:MAG: hypothetical protein ACK5A0_15345, partial [Polaromonas sp.]